MASCEVKEGGLPKLNRWLISLGTAVLLAFSGWVATSIIEHSSKLAAVEATEKHIESWLTRVEQKIDRLLRRTERQ